MATGQNDPLSAQALRNDNTYAKAVRNRLTELITSGAQPVGNTLLGKGTANNATAAGQEAYRQHVIDAAQNGQDPMSREEFFRSQQAR